MSRGWKKKRREKQVDRPEADIARSSAKGRKLPTPSRSAKLPDRDDHQAAQDDGERHERLLSRSTLSFAGTETAGTLGVSAQHLGRNRRCKERFSSCVDRKVRRNGGVAKEARTEKHGRAEGAVVRIGRYARANADGFSGA